MKQVAFEMKLLPNNQEEYKKRHDEIWPSLVGVLKQSGISDYSIFLNPKTDSLFGVLSIKDELKIDELPKNPIMQKWWAYMKDIMETHPDNSPVSMPLIKVFFMP
ncbi:MAG: L-rhamnose mutarotase [Bacteroidota bacterium]|jgi:L-rhamnose mutarotase